MHRSAAVSFLPSTAVLELSYRCNHACLFCSCPWYAPLDAAERGFPGAQTFERRPELDVEAWKRLIERLCGMGITNIALTGGEPLLKEGVTQLLEHAAGLLSTHVETVDGKLQRRQAPPKLYLLSNGKQLSDAHIALCAKHDIHLSLSLPGLKTFAEHTGGGDPSYVLEGFRRAHAAGVKTTVGITVTALNFHELYETIAEALIAGADSLLLNRFLAGGRGILHAERLKLGVAQVREMLDIAESILARAKRRGSVGTELPLCVADPAKYEHLHLGSRCSAAIDFFVVDPSGWLRVCNHSTQRLVHVDELEALKRHPYWQRFTQRAHLPQSCGRCSAIGRCDGGCREAAHIAGGRVDALDELMLAEDAPGPLR
ncbi:MAG: radical SAM protein [Myxococcota bacterium]|jgi:radical SAM protein with 4Fe4S-binding SPASM domain|nr:radical SAM protein [Myxococcota bacterium]